MAYEMVMPYHLHMPSYFLETFTEYPYLTSITLAAFSLSSGVRFGSSIVNTPSFTLHQFYLYLHHQAESMSVGI